MSEQELYEVMPPDLRTAIAAGCSGLALLPGPVRDAPAMLVCAAPRDRLDAITAVMVRVGPEGAPPGSREDRLVVLSVGPDPAQAEPAPAIDDGMCVGIDLGDPGGRWLAARMAEGRGIPMMKVASESRRLVEQGEVVLGDSCSAALRRALARAEEWHTEAPPPAGFSDADWARLVSGGPGPRLFASDRAGDMVMDLAASAGFRGVDLARRPAAGDSALNDDGTGRNVTDADLELRFSSPAGPDVRVALGLGGEGQRGLVERMCERSGLVVLSLEEDGRSTLSGCVRLELTSSDRALARRAVGAARRREDAPHGN